MAGKDEGTLGGGYNFLTSDDDLEEEHVIDSDRPAQNESQVANMYRRDMYKPNVTPSPIQPPRDMPTLPEAPPATQFERPERPEPPAQPPPVTATMDSPQAQPAGPEEFTANVINGPHRGQRRFLMQGDQVQASYGTGDLPDARGQFPVQGQGASHTSHQQNGVQQATGGGEPFVADPALQAKVKEVETKIDTISHDGTLQGGATPEEKARNDARRNTVIAEQKKLLDQLDPKGWFRKGGVLSRQTAVSKAMAEKVHINQETGLVTALKPDGSFQFHNLPDRESKIHEIRLKELAIQEAKIKNEGLLHERAAEHRRKEEEHHNAEYNRVRDKLTTKKMAENGVDTILTPPEHETIMEHLHNARRGRMELNPAGVSDQELQDIINHATVAKDTKTVQDATWIAAKRKLGKQPAIPSAPGVTAAGPVGVAAPAVPPTVAKSLLSQANESYAQKQGKQSPATLEEDLQNQRAAFHAAQELKYNPVAKAKEEERVQLGKMKVETEALRQRIESKKQAEEAAKNDPWKQRAELKKWNFDRRAPHRITTNDGAALYKSDKPGYYLNGKGEYVKAKLDEANNSWTVEE